MHRALDVALGSVGLAAASPLLAAAALAVKLEDGGPVLYRQLRVGRGGTEFEQLREYGPDDEFRRIDWTATARTGKPIVRTYRAERNQTVVVMLDNGRIMAGRVDGVPRVEHAITTRMPWRNRSAASMPLCSSSWCAPVFITVSVEVSRVSA